MPRRPVLRPSAAPAARGFVSYFRVSTDEQGRSGLGLEAQRDAVSRYVATIGGVILAEFTEVESGKRSDRPELAKALAACRLRRATLVIAKLDRLARNLAFIANLMEDGTEFVAADMPQADRFRLHLEAMIAEDERRRISRRTKEALAAAKARGVKLGNPRLRGGDNITAQRGRAAQIRSADEYAADVLPYIEAARGAGCSSLRQLAAALTARGVQTPRGGEWSAGQVRRVLARAAGVTSR